MKRMIPLLLALMLAQVGVAQPAPDSQAQFRDCATTIDTIAQLEDRRDPKCYATASRLEDFMYGTPLSEGARFAKIGLQKEVILRVWRLADSSARAAGLSSLSAVELEPAFKQVLPCRKLGTDDWRLEPANGDELTITRRDKRQYATIAYGLRAILAVQQERLFVQGDDLLPLDTQATEAMKEFLDLYTLAALQIADREARLADRYIIEEQGFVKAWKEIAHQPAAPEPDPQVGQPKPAPATLEPYALTRRVVAQKNSSYEAYNNISLAVFLRNIQVYFARHRWAKDPAESERLKVILTEAMIRYANTLLIGSEKIAVERNHDFIRVDDVSRFTKVFIPHELNEFEDATFFPNLPREERITLEAYDMDAFRDGGLHWQYLQAAIDEPGFAGILEPDPFALELLVENIAQIGVLALRIAGNTAVAEGAERLAPAHIETALQRIHEKSAANALRPPPEEGPTTITSADQRSTYQEADAFFTDVTADIGLEFQHRSSDWLSRFVRGYAIRNKEVAVVAIPPAFQGAGAAAEDINGDGLPDVLLLSGSGNALYLNDGKGGLQDITETSGIAWVRGDGHPGEPRQPIIADFDNDGLQDIFISYVDDLHRLYRGLGDGKFEDVTEGAGLGGKGLVGGPATALDFDKDGRLDLYITYFGMYLEGVLPTLARRNTNGLPNRLFRNVGEMRFEDVTEGCGAAGSGWTQATAHTDFNADGWQDLIEGNDFGVNSYYQNQGDGTFKSVADKIGTDKPSFTMGVGIADLNGDLHPDFYLSKIVTMDKDQKYVLPDSGMPMKFDAETMAEMRVVEANDFFVSQVTPGEEPSYIESTAVGRGRSSTGWTWGADFLDFDNDGDDDLYVPNGMNEFAVYSSENPYYRDQEGNERDVLFADSSRDRNVLFINEGGKLHNVSEKSGADLYGNSRAFVRADLDGDGDLDMVLNNLHQEAVVYRNNAERAGNHWLKVRLIGDPEQKTTRDAVGATMVVTTAAKNTVWREVRGSGSYLATHAKEQHFGLGQSETADIAVHWPNGETLELAGLEADHAYAVSQKDGNLAVVK